MEQKPSRNFERTLNEWSVCSPHLVGSLSRWQRSSNSRRIQLPLFPSGLTSTTAALSAFTPLLPHYVAFQISLLPDSPRVTLLSLSFFCFLLPFHFFSPCMERPSSTVPSIFLRLSFGLIAVSNQHHIGMVGFAFLSTLSDVEPESRNIERAKTVQTGSFGSNCN